MSERPAPSRERWQPLRAGVVELFLYDQQEFRFRDGRLLLRGNNGTGKSKVLALMLPFLLDGRMTPSRVEPDGDTKKRMEWNLLLGGAHPNDERIGYTWLEFGRLDDGQARFVTLGCGLKAVRGRPTVTQWLFIAEDRRVGHDLQLVDDDSVPLTRERLEETLGAQGRVFFTDPGAEGSPGTRYRRAVDELLFGLGPRRYEALLELLIRIRQPQLSRQPNPAVLSAALTDALTPLDTGLLSDLAEAFRELEADRDRLRASDMARAAAARYLDVYRRYARLAARRRANAPRQAQAQVDQINRDTAAQTSRYEEARAAETAAEAALEDLARSAAEIEARESALRGGDAAADEQRLAEASARVDQAVADDLAAESGRREAADDVGRLAGKLASATAQAAEAAERADRHADSVRAQAEAARLPSVAEALKADDGQERCAAAIAEHTQALDLLRDKARQHAGEGERLRTAEGALSERRATEAEALDARDVADSAVADAVAAHMEDVRRIADSWVELQVDDLDGLLVSVADWGTTGTGRHPFETVAQELGDAALSTLSDQRAGLEQSAAATKAQLSETAERIEQLERGENDEPVSPDTRAPGAREGRVGAPLWRLVDFADDVDDDARAGLEGALEAAGLLDAWVTPDGTVQPADLDGDIFVSSLDEPAAFSSLLGLLRPAGELTGGVTPDVVDAVLRRIGDLDAGAAGPAAVSASGRFRQGLLAGGHRAQRARYIGREAREAARLEALMLARQEHERLREEGQLLAERLSENARRRAVVDGERNPRVDPVRLRRAHEAVTRTAALATQATDARANAETAVRERTDAVAAAWQQLEELSGDLGLPAGIAEIDDLVAAVGRLREALGALWPLRDLARQAATHRADALGEHEEAEARARSRADEHAVRVTQLAEARAAYEELERSVGQAVRDLRSRLDELASTRTALNAERAVVESNRAKAHDAAVGASALLERLGTDLSRAAEQRETAVDGMRRFAGSGVLAVGLPELDIPEDIANWSVTTAVGVARRIDQIVSEEAGDEAWRRALEAVQDIASLSDALSLSGDNASYRIEGDETIAVDVRFRGRLLAIDALSAELEADVEARRRLLDERERVIIENHLIDEVAVALHERITDAEEQVQNMNAELAARPTSTGTQLRLRWHTSTDGPTGLDAARRRLLRQTSAAWSTEDRAAVGAFLQSQMQAIRDADPSLPWVEQLTRAFDYRAWHRFAIERRQGNAWLSATGPASGGERVLAATVPLFAAASSHYRSAARDEAPRLLMLDEVFAGVDDDSRAKSLGLLAAFDLDVVMTSEREWGCYPEVPGLSIAQLSRAPDIDAVLVTHWSWDGRTVEPDAGG